MSNPFGYDNVPSSTTSEPDHSNYTDDFTNPFATSGGYVAVDVSDNDFRRENTSSLTAEKLRKQEEDLARREAEIEKRQQALDQKQYSAPGGYAGGEEKNWPGKCLKILHHDIVEDIPASKQKLTRKFYALVLWTWVTLLFNWIVSLSFIGQDVIKSTGSNVMWASFYLALGVPGSWRLWYMPLYQALKRGKTNSARYIFFLLVFLANTIFSLLMTIGIEGIGSSGLFIMISAIGKDKKTVTFMCLIGTFCWFCHSLVSIFLMKDAIKLWKGKDKSNEEYHAGFTSGSI